MPPTRHTTRAAAVLLAALAAGVAVAPGAAGQEATASSGAQVDKVGWWNRAQGPQEGEPDNPVRPALAPVPAPPNNVPANAVGVGAAGGDPTKVAAFGLVLDAAPGATADVLKLTLKEAPNPGANVASDQAKLVACPITAFWGEARNASWADRPEADCNLGSAEGTRTAEGAWVFDLTSMASAWLAPDGGPGQNGVLVMENVDAPAGFEVSFLDPASGGASVEFAASGGSADASDPFAMPEAGGVADFGTGGSFAAGPTVDVWRSDGAFDLPPAAAPSAPAGSATRPTPATPVTRGAAATGTRAGSTMGNLSPATLLLVPAGLGLALVLSLTLGASNDPGATGASGTATAAQGRRVGGVSRALTRRRRTETLPTNPLPQLREPL